MNGRHITQFDHALLDLLSLVLWSRMFDHLSHEIYAKRSVKARTLRLHLWLLSPTLPNLWLFLVITDIYHDYLHERVGTHWRVAEEAVSFLPANLRRTITPVASFQVDTEIHKREQDLIKVNTDCTIKIKSNNTI